MFRRWAASYSEWFFALMENRSRLFLVLGRPQNPPPAQEATGTVGSGNLARNRMPDRQPSSRFSVVSESRTPPEREHDECRSSSLGFRASTSLLPDESGFWSPDAIEAELAHVGADEMHRTDHRDARRAERIRMAE